MLTISSVTYRIEGRLLMEGATARIPEGHKVGLVGRNGTGKTTLFRMIDGELEPESGEIQFPKTWRIGRIAQEAPSGPQSLLDTVLAADTVRSTLLEEAETAEDPYRIAEIQTRLADIGAHRAPSKAAEILSGLGFPPEHQSRPCSDFSGGWRMRVALAGLLLAQPDLLLLDEPTNYLDLEGAIWLEQFLKNYPRTLILISHDRDLLNRAVDSILHLEAQKLTFYTGGYDTFERTRRAKLELQFAARVKQEAHRAHMQAFVDRFRYKASKARQAQSRLKALSKLEPIAAVLEDRVRPFFFPQPAESAPPIMTMESVSVGYGERTILSHLSLRIDPDDRIALLGANGNGKSTFAKLLAGKLKPMQGTFFRGRKVEAGYFAQHQLEEMDADDTPLVALGRLMPKSRELEVRTKLGAFGFSADKAGNKIETLSGGEKARLMLALASFGAPNLLILDEPTNHLDIDSREALIHAVNDYQGAVILISHDRHILETCADTLWLVADGRVRPFEGDLDDYTKILLAERRNSKSEKSGKGGSRAPKQSKPKDLAAQRDALAAARRTSETQEKRMAELNAAIAKVDVGLATPGLFEKDPTRGERLARDRGQLVKALESSESEWLAAMDVIETAKAESEGQTG